MPRAGLDAETVTEAAAGIVDAEGRAALTLARLALGLGVAPPSLYKHVTGLDDLVVRVTTVSIRRLTDVLAAAALGRSGRQALLAVAAAYRSFAIQHPGLYALTQAALDPGSAAQQAEATRAVEVFQAAISGYGVPDDLSVHATRIVRAGLHGFADIETHGGFQMSHPVEDSFLMLVDALDACLSKLGSTADQPSED